MTRINVVPVEELCDQHLLAEWRELPRMRSYSEKTKKSLSEIPSSYTLGEGHMTFFLDKGEFLESRHAELTAELLARGFSLNNLTPFVMSNKYGKSHYVPTELAMNINRERIAERLPANARWAKEIR